MKMQILKIIIVFLIIGLFITGFVKVGITASAGNPISFDPFLQGWNCRKQITIDHTRVTGFFSNFPVLISITDSDLKTKAQTNGNDIVFTNAQGIKLNHEIESYDSTTGELIAWVNVTSLSPTSDTTLYLYYGNPTSSNQQNPYGVWNAGYNYVYHMKDNSPTTVCDSTSHRYNSTKMDVGHPSETIGKIGTGENFVSSTNDYLNLGDEDDFTFTNGQQTADLPFSISAWIKLDPDTSGPTYHEILSKYMNGGKEYDFY